MVMDNLCAHCQSAPRAGASKYCKVCRRAARAAWIEMIRQKGEQKKERTRNFQELVERAVRAGFLAGEAAKPIPMTVTTPAGVPVETVSEGVCGFAWVKVRPATSSFARWLVAEGLGKVDSYSGGVTIWVGAFGQSLTRKVAYATAYAAVLREAGIQAYEGSRLD